VLLAGSPVEEPSWAFPWAVQVGPGRFRWDEPSTASTRDLRIGPDTADPDRAVLVRELGAVTEHQIAEVILTRVGQRPASTPRPDGPHRAFPWPAARRADPRRRPG